MERVFEVKQKTFCVVSQVLSFRLKKQTRKNVADTNFKAGHLPSRKVAFICFSKSLLKMM